MLNQLFKLHCFKKFSEIQSENMCLTKNQFKTCKMGHEYTPENTYVGPNNFRQCRQCRKDAKQRFDSKIKKQAA